MKKLTSAIVSILSIFLMVSFANAQVKQAPQYAKIEITEAGAPMIGSATELNYVCSGASFMVVTKSYTYNNTPVEILNIAISPNLVFEKVLPAELGTKYDLTCKTDSKSAMTASYKTPDFLPQNIVISTDKATLNQGDTATIKAATYNGAFDYCDVYFDSNKVTVLKGNMNTVTYSFAYSSMSAGNHNVYYKCSYKDNTVGTAIVTSNNIMLTRTSGTTQDPVICTALYKPVCGQPKSACNDKTCTGVMPTPQTYSNMCFLSGAGATYLYDGECEKTTTTYCPTGTFTDSSCVCKNGGSPIALPSGTRIQQFTCDTLSVPCTSDYAPVCGRARNSCDDMTATNTTACRPAPAVTTTYSNRCEMNKAGAIYMYDGVCDTASTTTPPATCPVGSFASPNCICPNGISPTPVPSGTRIQQFTCDKSVATSTQPSKYCPTGTFSDPECKCPLGTSMQTVNASTCGGSILMCAQVIAYACVAIPNYETPPYVPEIPVNPTPVCIEPTVNLGVGSRGQAVTDIQKFLNSNGYLANTPTGYFGSATRAAVIKFQSENGINTTGYVGQLTRAQVKVKSCEQLVPIPMPQPYTPVETSAVSVPVNTTTVNNTTNTSSGSSASVISSINVVAVAPGFSVSSVSVENGNKFTLVFKALDISFDSPHYVKLIYKNSSKSCVLTASFIPVAGKTYNLIRSAESSCILGGVIGALSEIDHIEIVRQ